MAEPSKTTTADVPLPDKVNDRLLQNGDFSDLIVRSAAGPDIKVHRNIVCTASKFFQAACTRGFKEGEEGVVQLVEEHHVVDGLIRYLYNVEVKTIAQYETAVMNKELSDGPVINCIELLIAADKYDASGLKTRLEKALDTAFTTSSRNLNAQFIVGAGSFAFEQEALAKPLLKMIANRTARALLFSIANHSIICSHKDYAMAVMEEMKGLMLGLDASVVTAVDNRLGQAQAQEPAQAQAQAMTAQTPLRLPRRLPSRLQRRHQMGS